MRFYFDFATWRKMVRLALRETGRHRRKLLVRLLLTVPAVASFHALCFFLDGLLFPGLHRVRVKTPVFVLGHARSGTTLVHRLMSKDGERFSSFKLYECYFPSLLQKKSIRWGARFDARFLGGRIAQRVAAWEERRYAKIRDVHAMGLQTPEEDDIVFYWSCASGMWITELPYLGEIDFYWVDQRPPRERKRLMRFYADCVRRQLYLNGADKIHLSKNPVFAGRALTLIEAFPDARIVVPMRNPYETIPSLLKLLKVSWGLMHWPEERMQRSLRVLAEQSFHTYRYPLEVVARHPETASAVIDYRELTAAPRSTIERAYEALGFPVSPAFGEVLLAEEKRAKRHETGHQYSLAEFGLEGDAIRAELADLFERFGWDAVPRKGEA
jgi:omega-hydroxy-beta-dihydromenaquinone-9 sulfotransferase